MKILTSFYCSKSTSYWTINFFRSQNIFRFCLIIWYELYSEYLVEKNSAILSIAKVVTFQATPKFWGMENWIKRRKERTRWTTSKDFPVGVDVMACYSISIGFCALSSCWSGIIVTTSPYHMIICYFAYRLFTSSYVSDRA